MQRPAGYRGSGACQRAAAREGPEDRQAETVQKLHLQWKISLQLTKSQNFVSQKSHIRTIKLRLLTDICPIAATTTTQLKKLDVQRA